MRFLPLLAVLLLLLLPSDRPAASDATDAWNAVCASWDFPTYPVDNRATFQSVWPTGMTVLTFEQAFAGVKADWAAQLLIDVPDWQGGDLLNQTLENE